MIIFKNSNQPHSLHSIHCTGNKLENSYPSQSPHTGIRPQTSDNMGTDGRIFSIDSTHIAYAPPPQSLTGFSTAAFPVRFTYFTGILYPFAEILKLYMNQLVANRAVNH